MGPPSAAARSGASFAGSTPRRSSAESSGPNGAPASSLSAIAPAMMAIGAAWSAAAGFSGAARVSLFGAASAVSILSTRAARAVRSAGAVRLRRLALELRDPRREVGISPRAPSASPLQALDLRRQTLGGFGGRGRLARGLGVRRLQRRHPLVEFRCARRRRLSAGHERAHPLLEARDGGAVPADFGGQRRIARRACASTSLDRFGSSSSVLERGRYRRRRWPARKPQPRNRASQHAAARSARGGRFDSALGQPRFRRRLGLGSLPVPGDFAFDDARIRPPVAIGRGARRGG